MSSVQNNEHSQILQPKIVVYESDGYGNNIFAAGNENKNINSSTVSAVAEGKCCLLSNYKRHKFCLNLLSYKCYALCYVIIILIQVVAFVYDLWDLKIDNLTLKMQPRWFVLLNMICLALMLIDILIHLQAFQLLYFKSIINILDLIFSILCIGATPIFWYVPGWILQSLLFFRFTVRLLRRHTFRKQYMSARNIMIDFKAYEANTDEQIKYDDLTNIEQ